MVFSLLMLTFIKVEYLVNCCVFFMDYKWYYLEIGIVLRIKEVLEVVVLLLEIDFEDFIKLINKQFKPEIKTGKLLIIVRFIFITISYWNLTNMY